MCAQGCLPLDFSLCEKNKSLTWFEPLLLVFLPFAVADIEQHSQPFEQCPARSRRSALMDRGGEPQKALESGPERYMLVSADTDHIFISGDYKSIDKDTGKK